MPHSTSFDRRFYRAERILAVRTAIRANRGAVWARLEPARSSSLILTTTTNKPTPGPIQINTQCVSEVLRKGQSGSRQVSGSICLFISNFLFNCD